MPVIIDEQKRVSSSTLAVISSDPLKMPEMYSDYRLHAARRQSRIVKYICEVKEGDDMEQETDLEKIIHRNRKMDKIRKRLREMKEMERKQTWGRLRVVWKGSEFIAAKKPQDCLQELIEQKQAQRRQVKLHKPRKLHSPKFSERDSGRPTFTLTTPSSPSISQKRTYSGSQKHECPSDTQQHEDGLSRDGTRSTMDHSTVMKMTESWAVDSSELLSQTNSPSELMQGTLPRIQQFPDSKPSMSHTIASTPSTPYKTLKRGRSHSRNLFTTKKATGNEESYMFMSSSHFESKTSMKKKPKSSKFDKSNIFNTSAKNRFERRHKDATKVVPELKQKISAEGLVKAFISEQFLGLRLKGPRADIIRRMYDFAILKQTSISQLIVKYPEILPTRVFKDLIAYKKQFEVTPVYLSTCGMEDVSHWRAFFNESLKTQGDNILAEVERDVPLYPNFYKNLIITRGDNVKVSLQLVKERKKLSLREIIVHITLQLRMSRHVPGSSARLDMMSVMAAATYNEKLLMMLALSVDDWLDQLAKCLGSYYKSVREETCQVLCYMIKCYPLMRALYISKYFDVVSDLASALLKYMDTYEESFEDYYIVLMHLMHYTPSRGLLECILDRQVYFKNVQLIRRWPKLTYYAFKYWPDDPLKIKSPLFGKRVIQLLENAIRKPLTQKYARAALYHFQLRYDPVSRLFTVFSDKAEKAYMIALGLLE